MDKKLTAQDWIFWSIFTLLIIIISFLIFWILGHARFDYMGEIAFIIFLIVYAGWKKAFYRFSIIILVCILIYLIQMIFESPEYKDGLEAFNQGDYITAIKKFKTVIANEPEHYNVAYKLCISQYNLGQYKEALPNCNRAINYVYPLENESYAARARVYKALNMPSKAIRDYTKSLKSFNSWYVLWERCVMYNRVKQYEKAIKDCHSALKLNKDFYDVWWPLGNAYYAKNEYSKALKAYLNYQHKANKTPEFMQKRIVEIRGE